MASDTRLKIVAASAGLGLIGLLVALAIDSAHDDPAAVPATPRVDLGRGAAVRLPTGTITRREAAERVARRHGVQLVIDGAIGLDMQAPSVPDGDLEALQLESTLRDLLAGHEVLFHYGSDQGVGASRLRTVWVFAGAGSFAVAPAARPGGADGAGPDAQGRSPAPRTLADARDAAVGAGPNRGLDDPEESARLDALNAGGASDSPTDLRVLRQLIDADPSEAVRIQALDAFVSHPHASDDEVRALLDGIGGQAPQLLAEHARTLRESRAAPAADALTPDPIEEPR